MRAEILSNLGRIGKLENPPSAECWGCVAKITHHAKAVAGAKVAKVSATGSRGGIRYSILWPISDICML